MVLIHGRYVIVRPQTREIVYIIEGGGTLVTGGSLVQHGGP